MASSRRPKGTVVRHIPDWKVGQLAALNNVQTGGAIGTDNGAGLFNDSGQGQVLVVWHVYAFARLVATPTTIQLATLGFLNGNAGQITTQGQPLDLQQPWPGGSCFTLPHGASFTTNDFMDVPMGPDGWMWPHNWPLCVVRPGFSLIVNMFGPVQDTAVGFVWEVTGQI